MQDPDMQGLYRAWANDRWPRLAPVEEVRFSLEAHGPYSEYTPDVDAYVEVSVKSARARRGWSDFEIGLADLLQELLAFQAEHS